MLDTGRIVLSGTALSLFQEGLRFAAKKEYRQALQAYNQVLQLCDKCPDVWHERGLTLESLGDYPEAVNSYDRALELELNLNLKLAHAVWHARGNAFQYGLGDYESAIKSYDRALQLQPDHYLVWQNRGNALLYGLGRPAEAMANYDRAIYHSPNFALAWRNRGNALVELGRYQEAIDSYDQSLALDPGDQVCHYARSNAASQLGLADEKATTDPNWYGRGYSTGCNVEELMPAKLKEVVSLEEEEPRAEEKDEKDTLTPVVTLIQFQMLSTTPVLIVQDSHGQREVSLDQATYTIGRDSSNNICLNSQFASRHHATLIQEPTADGKHHTYRIIDGNLAGKRSTNGLLINGRKQASWELNHRDEVVLGPDIKLFYLAPIQEDCVDN